MNFPSRISVNSLLLILVTASATAQKPVVPAFWDDTLSESPIYPVGDAAPVYRAVLDLLYLDGSKRPSVIIMHDSAEGHMGGPCPFDKCPGRAAWKHKSRMDTATVIAYARQTRKRPGIRPFGYPIPIVFISYDDVRRMDADGTELIARHPLPNDLPKRTWGFWAELQRKYPGAWGVTTLSKVAFNKRHTEALVQAHQWCGDDCRIHETLFLKQTKGRWRVVERIPEEVDQGYSPYGRYVGPFASGAKESVLIPVERPGVPSEATARADVYRTVLDSLYFVNGEQPKRIVVTNWFYTPGTIPAHTSAIDSALIKRFAVLGAMRAPFDAISGYRIPVSTLPLDSVPALRERGAALDVNQTGYPFYVALARKYPGAWGMLGISRIAFNADRSQALVNTYHACGNSCVSTDTWFLTRSGKKWQIAERIPGEKASTVEVEPLRYVGVDVSSTAYRPRRVVGIVTEAETGVPVPGLTVRVRRMLNSGVNVDDPSLRTDSLGRYSITRLPLGAAMTLIFECPNGSKDGTMFAPLYVSAGLDTTITTSFSLGACNGATPVEAPLVPSPLSGAEAFIGNDSARFVFPRQPLDTYTWDLPIKGAYADSPEYMWDVRWEINHNLAGEPPYLLWLIKRWKPGGPHKGSLQQLIAGVLLEPMVDCSTCDAVVFPQPDTDHSKVFATVEKGQLVFVVRGADAVRRIFPRIPATVRFSQTVRQTPLSEHGPGDVSSSQEVRVNCRNSDESVESRHRCDVKH